MKQQTITLALAMDYAAAMESCAAYITVNNPSVREPEAAYKLLRPLMTAATDGDSQEGFFVVMLNTKNKIIGAPVEVARGLLESCPIHPRQVFRAAIACSAASILLAHNHPSHDPTPSKEDIDITRRLIEAARILGIRIIDHLVCGHQDNSVPGYVSLPEKNLVAFE